MKKRIFYTEIAYILGLIALALGTAFMEKADFGLSMVVAPPYILHLKISEFLPFFTFGMAQYTFQAVLVILLAVFMRKIKLSYFFSFVTAVIFGFLLDGVMLLTDMITCEGMVLRVLIYGFGMLCCTFGIALLFRTYIPPEVYELFVKEVAEKYGFNIHRCKTVYDCTSCVLSVILSFAFFGFGAFRGISYGTVVCALVNGTLISVFSKLFDRLFTFEDGLKLKKFFER
jgi:uncharacterized membrane protein YczE